MIAVEIRPKSKDILLTPQILGTFHLPVNDIDNQKSEKEKLPPKEYPERSSEVKKNQSQNLQNKFYLHETFSILISFIKLFIVLTISQSKETKASVEQETKTNNPEEKQKEQEEAFIAYEYFQKALTYFNPSTGEGRKDFIKAFAFMGQYWEYLPEEFLEILLKGILHIRNGEKQDQLLTEEAEIDSHILEQTKEWDSDEMTIRKGDYANAILFFSKLFITR